MTVLDTAHTPTDPLNQVVIDLVQLTLLAKQAHWNVHGTGFGPLHALLDDIADFARTSADTVAERSLALGHSPDARAATIVAASSLHDLTAGPITERDVISSFTDILNEASIQIRRVLDATIDDRVTDSVLTEVAAGLDKLGWLVRANAAC